MKIKRITIILIIIVLIVLFIIVKGMIAFNSAIMEEVEVASDEELIENIIQEEENNIIGERNTYIF